jgi:AmmeMemoRadiSam system protein B
MDARKPYFAGSWYPARAADCEEQIHEFLDDTRFQVQPDNRYIGGIVPHAGWAFSGSLACNVIAGLKPDEKVRAPDTIVVFGMHLPPEVPGYIMTEGAWETPLGEIIIDDEIAGRLSEQFSFTIETPTRFTPDNTIELQLPFIKYFFPDSRLVPVGPPALAATAIDIGQSVAIIAQETGKTVKVIGSTDLTHYGPNFGFTPAGKGRAAYSWVKDKNDRQVIDAMLEMAPAAVIKEGLSNHNACCPGAAAAAIAAVKELGAQHAKLVGYSSSFEHSPGDTFVGYGGVLFH